MEINNVKKDHHNVTLRNEEPEKKYFPCPVCKKLKEVEMTKKGKPYLTCNDCGVQLFVRLKKGILKFNNECKIEKKGEIYTVAVSSYKCNPL